MKRIPGMFVCTDFKDWVVKRTESGKAHFAPFKLIKISHFHLVIMLTIFMVKTPFLPNRDVKQRKSKSDISMQHVCRWQRSLPFTPKRAHHMPVDSFHHLINHHLWLSRTNTNQAWCHIVGNKQASSLPSRWSQIHGHIRNDGRERRVGSRWGEEGVLGELPREGDAEQGV